MAVSRAAHLVLRVAGWLLTPLILIAAACVGAAAGLLIATRLSLGAGMVTTIGLALGAAVAALMMWVRLLRTRPQIRQAFDLTETGLPESPLTDPAPDPDRS